MLHYFLFTLQARFIGLGTVTCCYQSVTAHKLKIFPLSEVMENAASSSFNAIDA